MDYLFDNLSPVQNALSKRPFGLITDIDGTVSEIASSPGEAYVSPECREHLSILSGRLELVAAISGRPVVEARSMVGIDGIVYIGVHGLERWEDDRIEYAVGVGDYVDKVKTAVERLESLTEIEGLIFDNKGIALAIHYRNCVDKEQALAQIRDKISAPEIADDFKILHGKMVVDLRPPIEAHKGTAVRDLIERHRLQGGIYIGDDITDVDAFREMHPPNFISIGVMGDETPDEVIENAGFIVNGVNDVARFLKWLSKTSPVSRR
ncbi:MAG: trehalose-phosphatase [Chloroflexota bacterium]|nr:trehalose-phosphatase [Chloroflexota bacterium]